ncbi:STAS domain-containing protein [Streptomyces sp. NPDC048518]|uniref:STAS domain-containing protein n=1 Tax=Streptomyces sp. NPDC048518 TaxID=3155029 RepID=UPI0033CC50C2
MTVHPFTSRADVHAGAARVTLVGELDLDAAPYVRDAVAACLVKRPTSLDLDLTGVSFCDCAGLNSLLVARNAVLWAGVGLRIEGVGEQLSRLLALIGAESLFLGETAPAAAAESPLRDLLA